MSASPIVPDGDGVRIAIRVTPRARKSSLGGMVDTGDGKVALGVKLAAPPVDGAANQALVDFIAEYLEVPRSAVRILSGERSRLKLIHVSGCEAEAIEGRLALGG